MHPRAVFGKEKTSLSWGFLVLMGFRHEVACLRAHPSPPSRPELHGSAHGRRIWWGSAQIRHQFKGRGNDGEGVSQWPTGKGRVRGRMLPCGRAIIAKT